ncbi:AAA family ATPase [Aspergillus sclerotioniger CBS 115572]|uniref:AAA family ATPase n=1 Tax=Aspergillus sclerotioniger CBS 115572 TaxID=1450535 RepID=A0A317XD33_9EURO|nr:AAA family ATPase [Aspergillus sclerotioniger CBS 115572]PWY96443.1 AAA family ATPase [Aspergillus sclerotioniger CBS 115572]
MEATNRPESPGHSSTKQLDDSDALHEVNTAEDPSPQQEARSQSAHQDAEQLETHRDDTDDADDTDDDSQTDGEEEHGVDEESWNAEDAFRDRNINVGVKYYDYQGFMNRMADDNGDYTIEALVSISAWWKDLEREKKRRLAYPGPPTEFHEMAAPSEGVAETLQLQRVRIRSPEILRRLAELGEWNESSMAPPKSVCVFCRPFHALAYFHRGMKQKLEKLVSDQQESDAASDSTAIDEMRCYVTFVEERILPLWKRFEHVTRSTPNKIRYDELSFLFRPGDLVYVPSVATSTKARHQSAIQNVFRLASLRPEDHMWQTDPGGWFVPNSLARWSIYCFDHDGEELRVIWQSLEIPHFSGEQDVTALPCYPLRFHPDHATILKAQAETGKLFKELVKAQNKHQYYSGWSLSTGIFKESVETDEPEHIESEVIIDIKEASRHVPETYPVDTKRYEETFHDSWATVVDENVSFRLWGKDQYPRFHEKNEDLLVREDYTYAKEAQAYKNKNPYIDNNDTFSKQTWSDEDFALLPRRVLGYVLRERRFTRLDVHSFDLRRVLDEKITLDHVQIKPGHRRIIRSTVSSHFAKVQRERIRDTILYTPDMIRGKGRGLVILLHGAPGVGKTATAEAVALEFEKPLFPITCGDLGTTPEAVEKSLKDIFRFAHLWDCILLLDEADVFLTQRDRTDVERNALVSVFLRVLEYYSGILFLTTNRVGALDEAFRSRVHLSLYYPHLNCDDTISILSSNLARLPRTDKVPKGTTIGNGHIHVMDKEIIEFVKTEYEKTYRTHRRGPWNGRQIRNAVQIASCLALFDQRDKSTDNDLPVVLTAEHFRTVNDTIEEFDRYLVKARRADDRKLAHMEGLRYDAYEPGLPREPAAYDSFSGYDSDNHPVEQPPRRNVVARTPQRQTPYASSAGGRVTAGRYSSGRKRGPMYETQRYPEDEFLDDDMYAPSPAPGRRFEGGPGSHVSASEPPRSRAPPRSLPRKEEMYDEDIYPEVEDHLEEGYHLATEAEGPRSTPRSVARNARYVGDYSPAPGRRTRASYLEETGAPPRPPHLEVD